MVAVFGIDNVPFTPGDDHDTMAIRMQLDSGQSGGQIAKLKIADSGLADAGMESNDQTLAKCTLSGCRERIGHRAIRR